jgi:hypothetical protein
MVGHPREWEVNAAQALAVQAVLDYTGDDPRILHAQSALLIATRPEEERDTEPCFVLTPEEQRQLRELQDSTRPK